MVLAGYVLKVNPSVMRVGVLALQGAFIEHQKILRQLGIETRQVRLPEHLDDIDALIIPGGESTTIRKLAKTYDLIEPLREFAEHKPVWGTCAGMIALAKDIGGEEPIVGAMNITVNRNAFGRQIDSFEADLMFEVLGDVPFHAIFIRAPIVTAIAGDVVVLSRLSDGRIVAVREGHLLATAFHPELTNDTRLHQYFLDIIAGQG